MSRGLNRMAVADTESTPSYEIDEIDANIRPLVDALNAFPGITTFASCGGHHNHNPANDQVGERDWYIRFHLDWTEAGRFSLEFLAFLVNEDGEPYSERLWLFPKAPPPYLNGPGTVLCWCLVSWCGTDPNVFASYITEEREVAFVPADRAHEWFKARDERGRRGPLPKRRARAGRRRS